MKRYAIAMAGALALCLGVFLQAGNAEAAEEKKSWDSITPSSCPEGRTKPSPHCSNVVTPTFGPDGTLWIAWVNDGRVYVSNSADQGRALSPPMPVNPAPQAVDHNGENRPKVVVAPDGTLYVTYTIKAPRRFTGDVLFSRSLDGGQTFSAPRSLNDATGATSLRFESLAVNDGGDLFITWLDKRDLFAAKAAEKPYTGSAIYFTHSTDRGETFAPSQIIAHSTCECCRTAVKMTARGAPVVIWRHIFPDMSRDHAVNVFTDIATPGETKRVSSDDWPVEACPHHGPSLSIDDAGVQHVTWFTMGDAREGGYYAHSRDGGQTFEAIRAVGRNDFQAEHPFTIAHDGKVHVAWKEFDGEKSLYRVMSSTDGGQTWSPPRTVLTAAGASDHPFLAAHDGHVYATWRNAHEGWRITRIGGAP